jgi:ATP-binding cassette subfamily B protein
MLERSLVTDVRGLTSDLELATPVNLRPSPELLEAAARAAELPSPMRGFDVRIRDVEVKVAGHVVLDQIDLEIPAGAHVAVVGRSGAGKSTLVGLLLGWYRPSRGEVSVDGLSLTEERQLRLRESIAWVDPAVQLWNRSFVENVYYGVDPETKVSMGPVLDAADLHEVLSALPDGLQTNLGEAGSLVSGGQGQRVRIGRALLRRDAGLVLLDEPLRGLDRKKRERVMRAIRGWWKHSTLVCVTHDIEQAQSFDQVLVVEDGKIVERGEPQQLAAATGSVFRRLLDAERTLKAELWGGAHWRRLWLEGGKLRAPDQTPEGRAASNAHGSVVPLRRGPASGDS